MLTKSLVKVGNSYAVVLDRTLMDLVGIAPEVPVQIQAQGRVLAIRSTQSPPDFEEALDRVFTAHSGALHRLAK